jgi:hypothetical protein
MWTRSPWRQEDSDRKQGTESAGLGAHWLVLASFAMCWRETVASMCSEPPVRNTRCCLL